MSEEVPKYLALTGESDALYDQRIYKVLKSNIPADSKRSEQLKTSKGSKLIDYSNKYGILVNCLQKGIGLKDANILNKQFTSGIQIQNDLGINLKETPTILQFSPNEDYLAVVTKTQILIFKTIELTQKKQFKQISLNQPIVDIKWTSDKGILYWKYQSTAYHYSFQTATSTPFPDTKCTSAQILNNHFVLAESFTIKIFDEKYSLQNTINYPDEAYTSEEFYGINMTDTISITKLNNLQSQQFKQDDVYAFVEVFYQIDPDDDTVISNKYLFFARGNLKTQNVEFKGGQLLYNNKNDRELYIENQEKRGFSVRSFVQRKIGVYILSIERSDSIYMVEINKPFQQLKLIDFIGKYSFRFDGFVGGLALLKNLLQFQKTYEGSSKDLQTIIQTFKGKYLNIGIKGKDMDILVPFPISILAWNDHGAQIKQYLVVTTPNIDREDEMDVKLKHMKAYEAISPIIEIPHPISAKVENNNSRIQVQNAPQKQSAQPEGVTKVIKQIDSILNLTQSTQKVQTNKTDKNTFNFSAINNNCTNKIEIKPDAPPVNLPNQSGTIFSNTDNNKNIFGLNQATNSPFNIFNTGNSTIFPSTKNIFQSKSTSQQKKVDNKLQLQIKELPANRFLSSQNQIPNSVDNPKIDNKEVSAGVNNKPVQQNNTKINSPNTLVSEPKPSSLLTKVPASKQTPSESSIFPKKQQIKNQQKQKEVKQEEQIKEPEKQSKIKKYLDKINQQSKQFEGFLRYIDQSKNKRTALKNILQQSQKYGQMVELLQKLQKQESLIEASILQFELFTKKRNNSRIQLSFNTSESNTIKIQQLIQNNLNQYKLISKKLQFLNTRYNKNRSIGNLEGKSQIKEIDSKKILDQQRAKIQKIQSKVQNIFQKYNLEKCAKPQFNQEGHIKFEYNEDVSSNDSVENNKSFLESLKSFSPTIVTLNLPETTPMVRLQKIKKRVNKQLESKVQKKPQKKSDSRLEKGKARYEFKEVPEQNSQESSDQSENLQLHTPILTQQISVSAAPQKKQNRQLKKSIQTKNQKAPTENSFSNISFNNTKPNVQANKSGAVGSSGLFGGLKLDIKTEQQNKKQNQKQKQKSLFGGISGIPAVNKPKQQNNKKSDVPKLSEPVSLANVSSPSFSKLPSQSQIPAAPSKSLFDNFKPNDEKKTDQKNTQKPVTLNLFPPIPSANDKKQDIEPKKDSQNLKLFQPPKVQPPKVELPKPQSTTQVLKTNQTLQNKPEEPVLNDVATALIKREQESDQQSKKNTSNNAPSIFNTAAPSSQQKPAISGSLFENKPSGNIFNLNSNKPSSLQPDVKPPTQNTSKDNVNIFGSQPNPPQNNLGIFQKTEIKPATNPPTNNNIFSNNQPNTNIFQPQAPTIQPHQSIPGQLSTFGQSTFGSKPTNQPTPPPSAPSSSNIFTMGQQTEMKTFGSVSGNNNIFANNNQVNTQQLQKPNNIFNSNPNMNTIPSWNNQPVANNNSFLGLQMNVQQPPTQNWGSSPFQAASGAGQGSFQGGNNQWGSQNSQPNSQPGLYKPRK